MWECQLTHVLSDPPPSGASPLPQFERVFAVNAWEAVWIGMPRTVRQCAVLSSPGNAIKGGRGLAPDVGVSVTHVLLTGRHRGQAPSHSLSRFFQLMLGKLFELACRELCGSAPYDPAQAMQSKVGGGLPPMWECQLTHVLLTGRHRGQAPSHMLCGFFQLAVWTGMPRTVR